MMARNKKKRNKPYRGADAVDSTPNVQRYTAVVRSPLSEWWHDHQKQIKTITIAVAVIIFVGYLIFELIRLLV